MSELVDHITTTAIDLSQKVRESVLAGNAHAAVDWSAALENTCAAIETVKDEE
jgi:hypothetical protein